ncbi:uncharacterized protein Z518_02551 [Rhinocladiella mackenziei CBS 650.93]|uniref:Enoyl reductase (ER) domain-containing protein n=1 Tax=Rhinocladiella mackenziei CBS 650.93 TaxID=1442369 RepID=A0A0D2G017_9EURO|nr:uncharacterized protein Z518_02551 [Rhinocladiella mackenziei CBS 650.93]KIX07897.1 hypothetical protein Z518_02551 [Rhinocladiella mackenziei CBS 650.93]
MSVQFDGQTIVITGTSHGFGQDYATCLANRGANIVVHGDNNQSFANHLVTTIRAAGGNAIANFSPLNDGDTIVAAAISAFGRIDALINNASDGLNADWAATDQDVWDSLLNSTFKGSYKNVRAVWAYFKKQHYGRILCTASIVRQGQPKCSPLQSAATYGQLGFIQTLAKEGAKYNILASVLAPSASVCLIQGTRESESERTAKIVATLIRPSNTKESGHLYEVENGRCSKLRWRRSSGALVRPDSSMTPGAILKKWEQINDFSEPDYPSRTADLQTLLAQAKKLPPSSSEDDVRLDGKVALVIGAGSGLGRAYAKYFASLGAHVVLNDLKAPTSVANEIRQSNGDAHTVTCSVEEGENIVAETINAYGRVDIVVNNADFVRDKSIGNMTDDLWDSITAVHLKGTFRVTRAAWPHLVKQGYGRIKCALIGFSEALAREGAQHNILVNTIAPVGSTPALAVAVQGSSADFLPEYCAPFVALLCSDVVPYPSTGALYELAAGWHARTRLEASHRGIISYPEESKHGLKEVARLLPPSSVLARIEDAKSRRIQGTTFEYTEREILLYNLTLGARWTDLPLVYENNSSFRALPTFGAIPYFNTTLPFSDEELLPKYDPTKLLHGEHYLEIRKYPIPTRGKLVTYPRLVEVIDKKKAAVIVVGYTARDAITGEDIFYNEASAFEDPVSQPGRVRTEQTTNEQAALYRLNGDRNAMHIDPVISRQGGFSRPILHGLCFFGIAGRHVYQQYGMFKNIKARFAGTVDPGQTLRTEMWKQDGNGDVVLFQMKVVETGKVCISGGRATLLGTGETARSRLFVTQTPRSVASCLVHVSRAAPNGVFSNVPVLKSKAIVLCHVSGKKGEVSYPLEKVLLPMASPLGNQLLIRILAAAFNHREVFLRQSLYPGVTFGVPICCDGCGIVVRSGAAVSPRWLDRRVIINPGLGWDSDLHAPESERGYLTLGASAAGTGTLQEYMLVDERDVLPAPEHLSDVEAAALPSVGLTAWRALMVQSKNAAPGQNILVTGIGGGVALMAMSLALAAGCNVYVTSSRQEKLHRAMEMGAKAGVSYNQSDWEKKLAEFLLPERHKIDAIIDGAGGDIVDRGIKLLKPGGVIVSYGMTLGPSMPFSMKAVIRQIHVMSSTMGSRKDFADMVDCVRVNKIRPVVSRTVSGLDDLEQMEELFDELAKGKQFGKLVVEVTSPQAECKL